MVSRFDQVFDDRADYIVLWNQPVRHQLPTRAPFWRERRDDYEIAFRNRNYVILDLKPGSPKRR